MTTRPRIIIPTTIKANDVIEVRTLITHVMETGQRKDRDGQPIPRNIISTFKARYRDKLVFTADLHPGTSANPFIAFNLKVSEPGELQVEWTDDKGTSVVEKSAILLS
jgi:sulfur-oxidizing protein SoxZ